MALLPGLDVQLQRRRTLAWLAACAVGLGWREATAGPPAPLMLAHSYRQDITVSDYGVSEKFDGLRGWWDGRRLWTRGGEPVAAPDWFTAGLPRVALDGELWAGRGRFAQAISTVRRQSPDHGAWRGISFMVFDMPAHVGTFAERSATLAALLPALGKPWLVPVVQQRVADHTALMALMDSTVRAGGEGLVLHRLASPYHAGRSRDLQKLKPDHDADARVLAHVAGRGKYEGMLGALQVETPEGLRFRLGNGFDDAQRRKPPAVGSWVSYRFRGENDSGIPRFASFLRVRADLPQ